MDPAVRCLPRALCRVKGSRAVVSIRGHGIKTSILDFPGGTVVKNPPASAGDTGSIPGPGRSRMLRSNSPCATTTEPMRHNC